MNATQTVSRRFIAVDWVGQHWSVAIRRKPAGRSPHPLVSDRANSWTIASPAQFINRSGSAVNSLSFMNTPHLYRSTRPQAFTLVEMLVVIAVIGILAGILLPTFGTIKQRAKVRQAQMEMANLSAAIKAYEKEYNRFPGSAKVEQNGNPDFTFGQPNGKAYDDNNRVVMFILLNHMDQAPVPLRDEIKNRNPRNLSLFDARLVNDGDPGGIGTGDHVFRDPWGNPYIITIDLDGNDKCLDAYYKNIGGPGLTGTAPPFEFSGDVMIWSLGPDKKFGGGFDKDNVLSWKH